MLCKRGHTALLGVILLCSVLATSISALEQLFQYNSHPDNKGPDQPLALIRRPVPFIDPTTLHSRQPTL